jgi:hypothetical protein
VGTINIGKVVVGGLVAGLVINVSEFVLNMFVLGKEMEAMMARMDLPPMGGSAYAVFTVLGFVLGIATIWFYAAIRTRYSPGPRTALCAGSAVWFFAYFYPSIGFVMMGLFPAGAMTIGLAWGLAELLIASVAGAALYKE